MNLPAISFRYFCISILLYQTNLLCANLLWKELPSLTKTETLTDTNVLRYFSHYNLNSAGSKPIIGTFKSDSFICVGQIYRPLGRSYGTVIFLHGLFDHVGTNVNIIKACLQQNYTFAAFDLPGHGLSSGIQASIGDFNEYATALDLFIKICDSLTDPPYVFIGHSTGCAIALEYITTKSHQPFASMVFLAPLIRSSSYRWSVVGYKVFHIFNINPHRRFRKTTHDENAIRNFRTDSLQTRIFKLAWAKAYFLWYDRIKNLPGIALPLTVIQGTEDHVVDWKYNLKWLAQKIKGLKVVTITGARHNLLNESPKYRDECIDSIQYLLKV
ncbi:MAG: alpha/beta hydrolase, partial [Fibrobacter sp.]|nr:alpha/beta hydrolase [Fibrobacter sp.]